MADSSFSHFLLILLILRRMNFHAFFCAFLTFFILNDIRDDPLRSFDTSWYIVWNSHIQRPKMLDIVHKIRAREKLVQWDMPLQNWELGYTKMLIRNLVVLKYVNTSFSFFRLQSNHLGCFGFSSKFGLRWLPLTLSFYMCTERIIAFTSMVC